MLLQLKCAFQKYAWGKVGLESTVANLLKLSDNEIEIDVTGNYAELWMGTHPNGPSFIHNLSKSLCEHIKDDPSCLGEKVLKKFGPNLPFLFKVLSVKTALSIQAHPNKEHAEQLHAERSDLYKDDNHKPEMAIALTPFEVLCGFRPIEEIKSFLKCIPEFEAVVGRENANALLMVEADAFEARLKICFSAMMNASENLITEQLSSLVSRIHHIDAANQNTIHGDLLVKLYKQYPNDVGCFGIYFFNYMRLKPGEAIFLGPNEPHAYLFGDCIECMACSDNVVRAGLTPKYKDVETLCEMLNYSSNDSSSKYFEPEHLDKVTEVFDPPVPDFTVIKYTVPEGEYEIPPESSASIIILLDGTLCYNNKKVPSGSIFFLGANEAATVNVDNKAVMFRACCRL